MNFAEALTSNNRATFVNGGRNFFWLPEEHRICIVVPDESGRSCNITLATRGEPKKWSFSCASDTIEAVLEFTRMIDGGDFCAKNTSEQPPKPLEGRLELAECRNKLQPFTAHEENFPPNVARIGDAELARTMIRIVDVLDDMLRNNEHPVPPERQKQPLLPLVEQLPGGIQYLIIHEGGSPLYYAQVLLNGVSMANKDPAIPTWVINASNRNILIPMLRLIERYEESLQKRHG